MISETQYIVLKRMRSGSKPLCGMDMLFNLSHKELIGVDDGRTSLSITNKGKAAMDEYEAGL
jgi:hypothetical protein